MSDRPHVARVIGVSGVAFTAFNCIVGSGIFGLPGLVAGLLGSAAIFAYLVSLVLVGLLGLCFAEAGSRVAGSGGLYAYIQTAYGPVAGGVAGLLLLTSNQLVSAAAVLRFLLDVLEGQWPALGGQLHEAALLALFYGLLAWVNIRGARGGAGLTVVLGIVKLAPLVLLVVAGLFLPPAVHLEAPHLPSFGALSQGTMLLFFAFLGVESGLGLSGEVRDPARTVPRALLLALALVGALYIGLQFATQNLLGAALAGSKAPLVDAARAAFGPWGGHLLLVTSALSVGGYIIADMLCSPRALFALAEDGQLPRWFAWVHPAYRTPARAIACYGAGVVALTLSGSFAQLVTIVVSGTLLLYLMSCLGVLRLRARGVAEAGTPFVVPGGKVIPLLTSALIVWLMATLSWPELGVLLGFVVVTGLIYAFLNRAQPLPA